MKKNISIIGKSILLLLVAIGFMTINDVSTVQAATDTSDMTKAELRALIEDLEKEIAELKTEKKSYLKFTQELRKGMSGEEVQRLQELLSTDPSTSPGSADGKFGPKTEDALRRFQLKFGLEGKGFLSPETMELINELLVSEDITTTRIPPGLLIAPGLRERVKVKMEVKNGKYEYKIEIEDEDENEDEDEDEDENEDEDEDEDEDENEDEDD